MNLQLVGTAPLNGVAQTEFYYYFRLCTIHDTGSLACEKIFLPLLVKKTFISTFQTLEDINVKHIKDINV